MATTRQTADVKSCPECGRPHRYSVDITRDWDGQAALQQVEASVMAVCSQSGRPFWAKVSVPLAMGQRLAGVQTVGIVASN